MRREEQGRFAVLGEEAGERPVYDVYSPVTDGSPAPGRRLTPTATDAAEAMLFDLACGGD